MYFHERFPKYVQIIVVSAKVKIRLYLSNPK